MKQVTLRPPGGLGALKAIIVGADLAFLAFPVWLASVHFSVLLVVIFAVLSLAIIVVGTFFGRLGLDMRVEVEPDAVRIYYFKPTPTIIPRDLITDVKVSFVVAGGYYRPHLITADGGSVLLAPLTGRTAAQGQEQAAKVRMALRDVAPAE